jgi:hypothetical protein
MHISPVIGRRHVDSSRIATSSGSRGRCWLMDWQGPCAP